MSGRVTYRVEERDAAGNVLQVWMRGTVERAQALHLFGVFTRADEEVGWRLYGPDGSRRLVVVAEPTHGAPVNAEAAADLAATAVTTGARQLLQEMVDAADRVLAVDEVVAGPAAMAGWVYERDDEPEPAPLPPGVGGYAVGGRR